MRIICTLLHVCLISSMLDAQRIDCTDPLTQDALFSPTQQFDNGQKLAAVLLMNRAISDRPISRKFYAAQLTYNVFKRPANRINVGMNVMERTAGSANLGVMRYGMHVSDDQRIGARSILSAGVGVYTLGFTIDRDKLIYSDQYTDHGYDPSIITMDALQISSEPSIDFSTSIGFRHYISSRSKVNSDNQYYSIKASVDGLMAANQGLYVLDNPSGRRYQLIGSARIKLTDKIYLDPLIRTHYDGLSSAILMGSYVELFGKSGTKLNPKSNANQRVSFGLFADTRKQLSTSFKYSRSGFFIAIDYAAGFYKTKADQRMPSSTGIRVGLTLNNQ